MQHSEMRAEFVEQVRSLRKRIFKRIKPKMLLGRSINGPMLSEICKAYIETINKGQLPNIENAWTYVCRSECLKALNETERDIDRQLQSIDEPLTNQQIEELKENVSQS